MDKKQQLDAVRIQLLSARSSDVFLGMQQVKQWLNENPEDTEIYNLLTDSIYKNTDLRPRVRELLQDMIEDGSKSAATVWRQLPRTVQDLLEDADRVYNTDKFVLATEIYNQILQQEPNNEHALQQIEILAKYLPVSNSPQINRQRVVFWLEVTVLLILTGFIIWQFFENALSLNMVGSYALPMIAIGYLVREILAKLAGDTTTDAPPPDVKKKKRNGK